MNGLYCCVVLFMPNLIQNCNVSGKMLGTVYKSYLFLVRLIHFLRSRFVDEIRAVTVHPMLFQLKADIQQLSQKANRKLVTYKLTLEIY